MTHRIWNTKYGSTNIIMTRHIIKCHIMDLILTESTSSPAPHQHQHLISTSTSSAPTPHQHQHLISTNTSSAPAPHQHQHLISTSTSSAPAPHQHQHLISTSTSSAQNLRFIVDVGIAYRLCRQGRLKSLSHHASGVMYASSEIAY